MLADAVREVQAGHSRMVVLVGTSSTGKTRACWEAVQPLAERGWRLWHPFDPTRAVAALEDLQRVQPRTVVWLNEAQHYLGDNQLGEQLAAALHTLLIDVARMPVLVLGTLWPEYNRQYRALPTPGEPDPHSRVRELLAGRTLRVPDHFDDEALRTATALADTGDRVLGDALTRAAANGQVTQDLAGAPELLHAYEHGTPAARAVLDAAMDARRLGVGLHLPQTFLTDAAPDYLTDTEYHDLTDDWAEAAYAELAQRVHGRQAPLHRVNARPVRRPPGTPPPTDASPGPPTGPAFRLADYLEQHGRTTRRWLCPPASFWHAAHTHLTHPDDLDKLARAASARHRLQWAHHLRHQAAKAGSAASLHYLAMARNDEGDGNGATALFLQAAKAGSTSALRHLAKMRERAGDHENAEALLQQAADAGDTIALILLATMQEKAGNHHSAKTLSRQATEAGAVSPFSALAPMWKKAERRGDTDALALQLSAAGDNRALRLLAEIRERDGDHENAEALLQRAVEAGNTTALHLLATMQEKAGNHQSAEALFRQAAEAGSTSAMRRLARAREAGGDQVAAEALARQAAEAGDASVLYDLAEIREKNGDQKSAEELFRQAANSGNALFFALASSRRTALKRFWPHGLDPDGSPTCPWQ
ncbi:tetratricopeptide repeat protein [Streptomyces sp. NPDC056255]|uniref:tetratricopeptide repeat protein n=1 Tax=Streptomyces sp. NPDC056255 TaxID=3345764 RepID=UPI0035E3280A